MFAPAGRRHGVAQPLERVLALVAGVFAQLVEPAAFVRAQRA
jgi:hypothetical protein